jgi:hypothetical protein
MDAILVGDEEGRGRRRKHLAGRRYKTERNVFLRASEGRRQGLDRIADRARKSAGRLCFLQHTISPWIVVVQLEAGSKSTKGRERRGGEGRRRRRERERQAQGSRKETEQKAATQTRQRGIDAELLGGLFWWPGGFPCDGVVCRWRRQVGVGCWENGADGHQRLVTGDLLKDAQCRLLLGAAPGPLAERSRGEWTTPALVRLSAKRKSAWLMWVPNPDGPPPVSAWETFTVPIHESMDQNSCRLQLGCSNACTRLWDQTSPRGSHPLGHLELGFLPTANCQCHASSFCKPTAQVRHDTSQL